MSTTRPYPLPINGVDLLANETSLSRGTVRKAVNVDIGKEGRFARRAGQTRILAGEGFHSIWHAKQRGVVLVAQANKLYKLTRDLALEDFSELRSPSPLSYSEYNGNVYWTNPDTFQWLPADGGEPRSVGVPTPETNPTLHQVAGTMVRGTYAVCMSYIDDRGEEGGTTDIQTISLSDTGGIQLQGLPIDPTKKICVYATDPDGEQLRAIATFPAVFPTYNIAEPASGGVCDTQHLKPLAPGEFVTWLAGRLYTAKNGVLYFSDALRPHLYNSAHNFIPFSGFISFIESVSDGLYVGDSRGVWFLRGTDPTKFELTLVNSTRAVKRSSVKVPPENFDEKLVPAQTPVVVWLSTAGYMVGMDGGLVAELHPERIEIPSGLVGRTSFLLRRGIKQVITPVNSTSTVAFGTAIDSIIP